MKASRPSGFPKAAWALIEDADLRRMARRAWASAPTRKELVGWKIAGTIAGVDGKAAMQDWHARREERRAAAEASAPIIVNCDGLCQPRNPGGTATFGWVARRADRLLGQDCGVVAKGPRATNNLAEYTAIIEALRWLRANGFGGERVICRSDSQLAIRQLDGTYAVRSQKILPIWSQAAQEAKAFTNLRFEWVPRNRNEEADALTRVAYDRSRSSEHTDTGTDTGTRVRAERAAELSGRVTAAGSDRWQVPSSSGHGGYMVVIGNRCSCTCPDFERRRTACKHIIAVRLARANAVMAEV